MPAELRPRVVLDTNLVVSAAISSRSLPDLVLSAWEAEAFVWLLSQPLFDELRELSVRPRLARRYADYRRRMEQLLSGLLDSAEWVVPIAEDELPVASRDSDDNALLQCALSGEASFLVTGDQDLLSLANDPRLGGLRIVTPREFLSSFVPT